MTFNNKKVELEQKHNYYTLTVDQQRKLAQIIAEDNMETVNADFVKIDISNTFYIRCGKRILDIVISIVALIVFLPINLIIIFITYFDVGRPIF